jgi:hypothetical protein
MKINKPKYERIWEGTDIFGYDFIDFRVFSGKKHLHWRLFINRNEVSEIGNIRKQKLS